MGSSLVAVSGGSCPIVVLGLLFKGASLASKQGPWGTRALEHSVVHGLSCSMVCGIFLDQESNPHLLHCGLASLPLSHQGRPYTCF